MRVGIDYRPALVNREGIGRYSRELVRGMLAHNFGQNLGLFGYTLAKRRFSLEDLGLKDSGAELLRLRLPSRLMPWLMRSMGRGVDDLVGGCQVFHHTQYSNLAVREAIEVATIHDCAYMLGADYTSQESAESMSADARDLVRRAKRVLVPSAYVGAEVVMHLGVWPERVSITHLGCDHIARDLPAQGFGPAKEPYILTVSRVDNRKNYVRMLKAFELLVKEDFPHRWVIAGVPGHGVEHFKKSLAQSPARQRVDWRHFVSDADLPRLYAQADLFLFASLNEGFGIPPLEAMACGTAVVTSCVTAMPEVCGDAAWFVEPSDVERIFEGARRLLAERDLRVDMQLRGKQQARKFTWKETAKSTLIAYRLATEPEPESNAGQAGPRLRRSL